MLTPQASNTKKVLKITIFLELIAIFSAIIRAIVLDRNPQRYFGEGGYITWISFTQLLIMAVIAFLIFRLRLQTHQASGMGNQGRRYLLWIIMAGGCVFLACDEVFQFHEKLDFWIHDVLELQETGLTDRIDALIVLIYLCCSLIFLYYQRRELRTFKPALPLFVVGFALALVMVVFDSLTDRGDIIALILQDSDQAKIWKTWLGILEESLKILAEGMFIVACYRCWEIAKQQLESKKYRQMLNLAGENAKAKE